LIVIVIFYSREIKYQSKVVRSGSQIEFEKLGLTVTLTCKSGDVRPIVFLHRTPADIANIAIDAGNLEEIMRSEYSLESD